MKTITLRLEDELWKAFRFMLLDTGNSMSSFLQNKIIEALAQKTPTPEIKRGGLFGDLEPVFTRPPAPKLSSIVKDKA